MREWRNVHGMNHMVDYDSEVKDNHFEVKEKSRLERHCRKRVGYVGVRTLAEVRLMEQCVKLRRCKLKPARYYKVDATAHASLRLSALSV